MCLVCRIKLPQTCKFHPNILLHYNITLHMFWSWGGVEYTSVNDLTKCTFNKIITIFERSTPEPALRCVKSLNIRCHLSLYHEAWNASYKRSWGRRGERWCLLLIGADERCVKWIFVLCCAPFTLWAIISSANSAALPQPTLIIDSLTTALTFGAIYPPRRLIEGRLKWDGVLWKPPETAAAA